VNLPDPPPKTAQEPGHESHRIRRTVLIGGLVLLGIVVVDMRASTTKDDVDGKAEVQEASCLDGAAARRSHTQALDALSAATRDLKAGDMTAAAEDLRQAADNYRAEAEAAAADPEISQQLRRAASYLDADAQAAEDGNVHLLLSRRREFLAALSEADDAIKASTVPPC
jgi:hypothetical protein